MIVHGSINFLIRDLVIFAPEIVAEFEHDEDAYKFEAELISKYGERSWALH